MFAHSSWRTLDVEWNQLKNSYLILRLIFECLRKSALKPSPEKCVLESEKVTFLGNVFTKEGLQPENEKIQNFLKTLELPKSAKQVKRLIGFLHFFRSSISNLNEHLIPFYKLLRKNVLFEITDEIRNRNAFQILREKLETTTTQTLRLAKTRTPICQTM